MTMIDLPDHVPDLRRLKGLYACFFLVLSVIVARLWYLQVAKGPELAQESDIQRIRTIPRVAPRGVITDRSGKHILATSRPKFVVSVIPDEFRKNPQILPLLASLLNVPVADLQQKLEPALRSRGQARFDPFPLLRDVKIEMLSRIEEYRLDLPGVIVTRDPVRFYGDDQLCTHILGVTRSINPEQLQKMRDEGYRQGDFVGVFGLERSYEAELRGEDGGTDIAVDARGRMQRSLGERPPVPGKTLQLAIDLDLQRTATQAMRDSGHPGAAVALDPRNGEVLAMVSYPSYDLNRFGLDQKELNHDPNRPMINRASDSAFPCGSTFKLVTAAAGLETGTISTSSSFYCPGIYRLGRQGFKCLEVHRSIEFYDAIGRSCNIFFYHTAQQVGHEKLADWAVNFGLGQKTGIDLPEEKKGLVPTAAWKKKHKLGPWYPGDTLHMGIGQGSVLVSPLQLADYTAAIANGGTLWKPHLVREIIDPQTGEIEKIEPEFARGKLGMKPENLNAIIEGMKRTLLPHGTAYGHGLPGLSIAGKTGTVEMGNGAPNNAMFVCFAPVEKPRIAIAILLEGGGFGAETAAPVARRMLATFFHIPISGQTSGWTGAKE